MKRGEKSATETEGQQMEHFLSVKNLNYEAKSGAGAGAGTGAGISGKKKILENINFELQSGILAVCGPNGSGKTTLLKIIKGLLIQSSGTIIINGRDVSKKSKQRLEEAGLVFQDANLQTVGDTVENDLAFGPENLGWDKEKTKQAVETVIEKLGMQAYRKQKVNLLSGGEKRCLAIGGVLAMNPSFLLLDEPFANLDFRSVQLVLKAVLTLKEEQTPVIIVSHEADKFLAFAEKTLVLDGGKQVFYGETSSALELMKEHGVHVPPLPLKEMSWL